MSKKSLQEGSSDRRNGWPGPGLCLTTEQGGPGLGAPVSLEPCSALQILGWYQRPHRDPRAPHPTLVSAVGADSRRAQATGSCFQGYAGPQPAKPHLGCVTSQRGVLLMVAGCPVSSVSSRQQHWLSLYSLTPPSSNMHLGCPMPSSATWCQPAAPMLAVLPAHKVPPPGLHLPRGVPHLWAGSCLLSRTPSPWPCLENFYSAFRTQLKQSLLPEPLSCPVAPVHPTSRVHSAWGPGSC